MTASKINNKPAYYAVGHVFIRPHDCEVLVIESLTTQKITLHEVGSDLTHVFSSSDEFIDYIRDVDLIDHLLEGTTLAYPHRPEDTFVLEEVENNSGRIKIRCSDNSVALFDAKYVKEQLAEGNWKVVSMAGTTEEPEEYNENMQAVVPDFSATASEYIKFATDVLISKPEPLPVMRQCYICNHIEPMSPSNTPVCQGCRRRHLET